MRKIKTTNPKGKPNNEWVVKTTPSSLVLTAAPTDDAVFTGVYITNGDKAFWVITCPCGERVTYPLNGLPKVDTLMPCGNPKHWAVRWKR